MAIHASPIVLAALQRAATEPEGLALLAGKSAPGLFAANAAGKQAAAQCKSAGLLRVVRTEPKGRTPLEICALTEHGLQHLLEQTSPRPVLEALLHGIERSDAKLNDLVAGVDQQRLHLQSLRDLAARLLEQLPKALPSVLPWSGNGQPKTDEVVLEALRTWSGARHLGDCPLPDLYRHARETAPKLTIGQFHDSLRMLHESRSVYLHPWTGPLYEMPEPAVALLSGHEIAYYVSFRTSD